MASRKGAWTEAFAVVRVDHLSGVHAESWDGDYAGPIVSCGDFSITVKEVVTTRDVAERVAKRLNELNGDKGCRYFWQKTHLFLNGGSFGGG